MNNKFAARLRLRTTAEFKQLFRRANKISTSFCGIYYSVNDLSYPRLGIVVAKKSIKRAVERNYFKRIVRESFRLLIPSLQSIDIVILAYQTAVKAGEQELRKCLNVHLKKLLKESSGKG
jgi:ribonuclease P protein component